jgi:uncharacterized protein (TIGR03083 family)
MATATAYLDRVLPAIDRLAERFAALVTSAPDPSAPIPGSAWTVRDATAHVVTVARRFIDGPEGRGTWVPDPRDLAALNDTQIQALAGLDMPELAARLRRDLTALAAQVRAYGTAPPSFRFHGGAPVAADVALGILLGELVVHGWDIARALGRPWPIAPTDVDLILDGVEPILPGWLDPTRAGARTATFELRLRGGTTRRWSFENGRLDTTAPAARRPDVTISADPVALLLVFYRRQPQWPHILRGHMLAWGRRPWLAFTLANRFHAT